MKKNLIAGGILALLIVILIWVSKTATPPVEVDPLDTAKWQTFVSEEFKFSVKHPASWQVVELYKDPIAPRINIFKKDEVQKPPFDHHSMVTHVSFFPEGVPTEGVFGDIVSSTVVVAEPVERAYDFILSDETAWATIVTPVNPPLPWQPGFIWIQNQVADFTEKCFRASTEIEVGKCNAMSGDRIIRYGSINSVDRSVQEEILKTFTFIK